MIEKLRAIVENADNPTEDSDEYDGAFSYKRETHQFVLGAYDGLTSVRRTKDADAHSEGHYYAGGYVCGSILQFMIVAAAAIFVYLL